MQELVASYEGDNEAQQKIAQLLLDPNAVSDYHLDRGMLKFKYRLYVGSANGIRGKVIKALHDSAVGGILAKGDVYTGYKLYFIGRGSSRMLSLLSGLVMYAKGTSMRMFPILDFCNLSQFHNRHGPTYPWISLSSCPYLMVVTLS